MKNGESLRMLLPIANEKATPQVYERSVSVSTYDTHDNTLPSIKEVAEKNETILGKRKVRAMSNA